MGKGGGMQGKGGGMQGKGEYTGSVVTAILGKILRYFTQ